MKKKNTYKALCIITTLALFAVVAIIVAEYVVTNSAKEKTFDSVDVIPKNKVGLLLGTSKYVLNGRQNLFYVYRIQAAVALFNAQKIEYIIISGDNGRTEYDEPTDMKNDLMAKGIPESAIYLDYAGFRTLDSVVRSKEIFGQDTITIISQQFHNQRAIYIATQKGMDAIGYNAKDVHTLVSMRIAIREKLARVKTLLDVLLGVNPKYLGETIDIS